MQLPPSEGVHFDGGHRAPAWRLRRGIGVLYDSLQSQIDKLQRTTDPKERQKLLQEHMQTLQEHLKTIEGMSESEGGSGGKKETVQVAPASPGRMIYGPRPMGFPGGMMYGPGMTGYPGGMVAPGRLMGNPPGGMNPPRYR